jgi:hypothetical protein
MWMVFLIFNWKIASLVPLEMFWISIRWFPRSKISSYPCRRHARTTWMWTLRCYGNMADFHASNPLGFLTGEQIPDQNLGFYFFLSCHRHLFAFLRHIALNRLWMMKWEGSERTRSLYIKLCYPNIWPPLWSSCWRWRLQTQRSRVRFPGTP